MGHARQIAGRYGVRFQGARLGQCFQGGIQVQGKILGPRQISFRRCGVRPELDGRFKSLRRLCRIAVLQVGLAHVHQSNEFQLVRLSFGRRSPDDCRHNDEA